MSDDIGQSQSKDAQRDPFCEWGKDSSVSSAVSLYAKRKRVPESEQGVKKSQVLRGFGGLHRGRRRNCFPRRGAIKLSRRKEHRKRVCKGRQNIHLHGRLVPRTANYNALVTWDLATVLQENETSCLGAVREKAFQSVEWSGPVAKKQ